MAFSEPNGSPSSMRILSAFVVLLMLGTWAAVSLRQNALQPLTGEHAAILIGALGLKAWQRGKENHGAGAGKSDTSFLSKTTTP